MSLFQSHNSSIEGAEKPVSGADPACRWIITQVILRRNIFFLWAAQT